MPNDFPFPRVASRIEPPAGQLPTAEFSFIVNGRTVQFLDQSTDPDGRIVDWTYDFGELPTAEFSYTAPGSRVANFTDLSTDVPPGVIVSWLWDFGEQAPTASFRYLATGLSVKFTDTSTSPAYDIVAWLWAFGDGTTSTEQHPTHVYATSGSFAVTLTVTDDMGHTSTEDANVTLNLTGMGRPFGPFGLFDGNSLKAGTQHFNLTTQSVRPGNIVGFLDACVKLNKKVILQVTGGNHGDFKTNLRFDRAKWNAVMDAYDTPAIQAAVNRALAAGILLGNSVMDEPFNTQRSSPEKNTDNSWGPSGWMKKTSPAGTDRTTSLAVDDMAWYCKQIFPTMPVGVVHKYHLFFPEIYYVEMDFLVMQYRYADTNGQVQSFIDESVAWCLASGGVVPVFSMNILDGGLQAAGRQCDPTQADYYICPTTTTQGRGTYCPNCRMTSAQVQSFGTALITGGAALLMWRWDSEAMTGSHETENQAAFAAVRAVGDTLAPRSLFRGG